MIKLRFGNQLTRLEIVLLFGLIFGGFLLSIYLIPAFAQIETPQVDAPSDPIAGIITPDSPFWVFDVLGDDFLLIIADPTNGDKARVGLVIADERLHEVKIMIKIKNLDSANDAQIEHDETMAEVESSIIEIEDDDKEQELRIKIEIEQRIKSHDEDIDDIEREIEIEIRGQVTQAQLDFINELFNSINANTEEVEIKIDNEKGRTKIELSSDSGLTEEQVRMLTSQLEGEIRIEIDSEDDHHDDDGDD